MRIWVGVLCSVAVGVTIGGAVAQHRLYEREKNYRAWCDSVSGQVAHEIQWRAGPQLVTICNR